MGPDNGFLDYPVCGLAMFGRGSWALLRDSRPVADAVRLVVLADLFAYNRTVPTMAWDRIAPHLEEKAPGLDGALREEYGDRRGPDLLDDTRKFVESLPGTSS